MVYKIDKEIKDIVKKIIKGNDKRYDRKKQQKESPFDDLAIRMIEMALDETCINIKDDELRKKLQVKIYESLVHGIPYEYMGETYCGRRQFYEYRNKFILNLADYFGMIA